MSTTAALRVVLILRTALRQLLTLSKPTPGHGGVGDRGELGAVKQCGAAHAAAGRGGVVVKGAALDGDGSLVHVHPAAIQSRIVAEEGGVEEQGVGGGARDVQRAAAPRGRGGLAALEVAAGDGGGAAGDRGAAAACGGAVDDSEACRLWGCRAAGGRAGRQADQRWDAVDQMSCACRLPWWWWRPTRPGRSPRARRWRQTQTPG